MSKKVRVRFAPSPTGGLHLGGVRTVLFNYLFAKQHNGDFILRIEDTDQTRFVEGAEDYIQQTLSWCGLEPDESPLHGGAFGPYRQSERKQIYRTYAEQLVASGHAYYAFDTAEELEQMRSRYRTTENPSPQYNRTLRLHMRNSFTLNAEEVNKLLNENTAHVIRLNVPENETVTFTDMIRGEVSFHTNETDDKVLLKADGMPTYHLAVVVDDYLMKITHAFRGEEWLPSAPAHILLWRYLFGEEHMPQWAHLPLILKPDGNGKLSKRDGDRLGFPVFAMDWKDPNTGEVSSGFRERGFLSQAFVNMLAMLGWNDGTGQEIFDMQDLINKFSIERVHKGGAKFDYEKAKWFNHEWIKKMSAEELMPSVRQVLIDENLPIADDGFLTKAIALVKDRCTYLTDFPSQIKFFFIAPSVVDLASIQPKWNDQKKLFFIEFDKSILFVSDWHPEALEKVFKELAAVQQLKPGDLLPVFRIMLVGGKFGPGVFDIMALLGKEQTSSRIHHVLKMLN